MKSGEKESPKSSPGRSGGRRESNKRRFCLRAKRNMCGRWEGDGKVVKKGGTSKIRRMP